MSSNEITSLPNTPLNQNWPHERPPTIADLRTKLCWICREEESFDEPSNPPRVWVHSCSCTLVAHESCLLTWIRLQDPDKKSDDALKCPQCKTRFTVVSNKPLVLQLLNRITDATSWLSRTGTVTVLTASALGISAIYGSFAVRCLVGDEMGDLIIGGRDPRNWRPSSFLNLPLIPWILIFSRVKILRSVVSMAPFLLIPANLYPSYTDGHTLQEWEPVAFPYNLLDSPPIHQDLRPSLLVFPPSPAVLFTLLPVVQWGYKKLYDNVHDWVLKKQKPSSGRRRRPTLQNGGPRPAEAIVAGAQDQDQDEEIQQPQDAVDMDAEDLIGALDRGDQVGFSGTQVCRILMGSLIIPPAANIMGRLLLELSDWAPTLKPFLGIKHRGAFAGAYRKGFWSTVTVGLGLSGPGMRHMVYEDLDPVWWRNTIGLFIFVLARDGIHLWHKYLNEREKKSRRILNRPFKNVDLNGLDLIV